MGARHGSAESEEALRAFYVLNLPSDRTLVGQSDSHKPLGQTSDRGTRIGRAGHLARLLLYLCPNSTKGQGEKMSRIVLGVVCGLVFGAIDICIMLPMSFPDKRAAITAAFIARFGIGFA